MTSELPIIAIITSGAYVSSDLAAEFGMIPPSFLPVGNKRLYSRQIEMLRATLGNTRLVLSLPDDFAPTEHDWKTLDSAKVEVVFSPPGVDLGTSLTYVILAAGLIESRLRILHGDTLLQDYPFELGNAFSAAETRSFYNWADYALEGGRARFPSGVPLANATERSIASGAFAIDDTPRFLRCLAINGNNFIKALDSYSQEQALTPIQEGQWLDFGHVQTYFQSRRHITTERQFNRLETRGPCFIKSSVKKAKIEAELKWYQTLPKELGHFAPAVYSQIDLPHSSSYEIEYMYLSTLSELFVFGELPVSVWRTVFEACDEFLTVASSISVPHNQRANLNVSHEEKTFARLEEYARQSGLDLEQTWRINGSNTPSLRCIVEQVSARIGAPTEEELCFIHGDFCFSNLLFDFRTQRVKVIDPRGLDYSGLQTSFGDRRYEAGKLHHSVIGLYDFIIANAYSLTEHGAREIELRLPTSTRLTAIQGLFETMSFSGVQLQRLKAIEMSTLLFFSMLPLHAENPNRQRALLANGLRLWDLMEKASTQ